MGKSDKDRFEVIYKQGNELSYKGIIQIILDRETGVQYLSQYNVGLTPLLDTDGTPVIKKVYDE